MPVKNCGPNTSVSGKQTVCKVHIVYPARLVVDGRTMANEFPDWSPIMQGNRVEQISHTITDRYITQAKQSHAHDPCTINSKIEQQACAK